MSRESSGRTIAARRETWRNVLHAPRLVACANRAATKLQQSCYRATAARLETWRNLVHTPTLAAHANRAAYRAATEPQQSCNRATAARRETSGACNTPGFLGIP